MTEKSVFVEALNLTLRTIEERARRYRNLVIAVTILTLLSILCAILCRQWLFLGALVLVVPLIGGFFILDSRNICHWKAEILEMSLARGLDLPLFLKTAAELRRFSPPTLQDMLLMISQDEREGEEKLKSDYQQRRIERKIVGATILLTTALVCLIGSAYYLSLLLLACGIVCVLLLAILRRRSR
jgi:hypothetical protein